ncbi:hypothetical protein ACO0R3_000950 [Hanseniaspora guilliermondii]
MFDLSVTNLARFIFLFVLCVGGERLLEIQPNEYIIVKDDNEKFKLSLKGLKYLDVSENVDISSTNLLKRSESHHLEKDTTKFWDKYQVFSFQDLMFDDSVLITLENTNLIEHDKGVRVNLPLELSSREHFEIIMATIDEQQLIKDMHVFIEHFTMFYNRFYKSDYGVQASNWIYEQLDFLKTQAVDMIEDFDAEEMISVLKIKHQSFPQETVMLKIKGSASQDTNRPVIIGSHIDSINILFPYLLRAPGVDDNATGTCINYLILKTYLEALVSEAIDWPGNDIEFHFYAGEEGGLLGSLDVFKNYKENQKAIMSVLVLDQIGHPDKNREMGLMTDFVSPDMVDFLELLIKAYTTIDDNNHVRYIKDKCGYGCSDHASAYKHGFPSGMLSESSLKNDNKFTHSAFDTIDRIDFKWLIHYYRIGVSYLLELSNHKANL